MQSHRFLPISLTLALLGTAALAQQPSELFPDAPRAFLGSKPEHTLVSPEHIPGLCELKFVHGAGVRLIEASLRTEVEEFRDELAALNAWMQARSIQARRIWLQSDESLVERRLLAEARSQRPLHDLTQFYQLELPDDDQLAAVCDHLNSLDIVELAYPLGLVEDPAAPILALPVGTPDFESQQGYKLAAPTGIDAVWGNRFGGGWGAGTVIADVETGWTDDHEDLIDTALGQFIGLPRLHYPWDHGTAVLGELIGVDNDFGVLGICYGAAVLMSTHQGSAANIPTALQAAANAVGVGDVIVVEAQCFGGPPGPYPCEYVASTFAVLQTATAAGTHVFAAAGNGDNDLDDAAYGGLFDRNLRDSGAVLCGASNGASLDKASFSNYGSRLDAHGWGFDVTSSGYGDLQGGPSTETYTATFSGTSSATPIVTGAGILIKSIYQKAFATELDPLALRALITLTGTPQGSGGQIGPRPDVRAALIHAAVPYLSITGPLTIGTNYSVINHGTPLDLSVTAFSTSLRSNPGDFGVYGSLFLHGPITRVQSTVFGTAGTASYTDSIPNDPNLIGTTIGYYQAFTRYQTGPGVGFMTNWVPVEVGP